METLIRCFCWCAALSMCGASVAFAAAPTDATAAAKTSHCSDAGYHRLDFWIGDWDVFDTDARGGPVQARARVDRIVDGCAIHELYEQADGLVGDSILGYDPVRRQWQQTWVTNRGSVMAITGDFKDDAVVLEGEAHLEDGRSIRQRITWTKQDSVVRESAVLSRDLGKTWTPAFDVVFVRHAGH